MFINNILKTELPLKATMRLNSKRKPKAARKPQGR